MSEINTKYQMMQLSKHKAFLEFIYIFDLHRYRSSRILCLSTTESQLWLSALFTSLIVSSLHKSSESFNLVSTGFLYFPEMVTRYFQSSQPLIHMSQHHYYLPKKLYTNIILIFLCWLAELVQENRKKAETLNFYNVFYNPNIQDFDKERLSWAIKWHWLRSNKLSIISDIQGNHQYML